VNNERSVLQALRVAPPLNNWEMRNIRFTTPESSNGWWQTYEIYASKRTWDWEYYPIRVDAAHAQSWNLWTAVLRDFNQRYWDQILELLNRM
jgi:hypothetical protein